MKLEIYFHPLLTPWIVTNEHTCTQKDGWNCGPIACVKVMEIYGFLPDGSIDDIRLTGKDYQTVVMEYYTSALINYGNDLKAEFHTKYDGKKPKVAVLKEPADCASSTLSDLESESFTQAKAMEKKNIKQKAREMKEMKRCGIAAMESGAGPGAVVTQR